MNRFDSNSQRTISGKKNRVTTRGLKVKINKKFNIPQIFEIVLESYYLTIIERISNTFPYCTNCNMFFHGNPILRKEIFTVTAVPYKFDLKCALFPYQIDLLICYLCSFCRPCKSGL